MRQREGTGGGSGELERRGGTGGGGGEDERRVGTGGSGGELAQVGTAGSGREEREERGERDASGFVAATARSVEHARRSGGTQRDTRNEEKKEMGR